MNPQYERSYYETAYPDGYAFDKIREVVNIGRFSLLLKKTGRKISRILDVGCGYGYFLKICDEYGLSTYGIDVSKYALIKAKLNTKAILIQQSVEDPFPFPDMFFDVVVAFDFIDHLIHPVKFLQETYRVLKRSGVLIIECENSHSLSATIFTKNWIGYADKTHVNLFSLKTVKDLLMKAEFTRIRLETRGLPYHPKMRPLRTSVTRKNFVAITAKMYKMFRLPLGLGDHIFAYCFK